MTKGIWVDGRTAQAGVLVALVGLGLLLSTLVLRPDSDDPNCAAIATPDRARECVAESAQTLDWEHLVSMLAVAVSIALLAFGGVLSIRSRRRVMGIAEAAELVESDVQGIRFLITSGHLVPVTSEGRTYVDVAEVERLSRASRAPEEMASTGPV